MIDETQDSRFERVILQADEGSSVQIVNALIEAGWKIDAIEPGMNNQLVMLAFIKPKQ